MHHSFNFWFFHFSKLLQLFFGGYDDNYKIQRGKFIKINFFYIVKIIFKWYFSTKLLKTSIFIVLEI